MKRFILPVALLLPLACSSGTDDEPVIVPERLTVSALAGGNGVLRVSALTLRTGPHGIELYVAVKNDGDVAACSAAVSVELFDQAERSLAVGIGGLLTQHFYRLTDGSNTIAACVGPGDVSMAAVMDLAADIAIEDVAHVVYRCPYFALDVVPIAGLAISHMETVTVGDQTAYTGVLVNELDVAVSSPSVTVFSMSGIGRPLGFAIARDAGEIPPGGSWTFETNTIGAPGVDYAPYPAGALTN